MKILLNILPEEKKAALVRKFRNRFFLLQTVLIFLLELYYIVILIGASTILGYQAKVSQDALDSFDQFNTEAKKLIAYQEEFKKVNAATDLVSRYQSSHLRWSTLPVLLGKLVPQGVVIIQLMTKDYTVSLSGQAETRDQFLQFEEALKRSECVSDVRVPISNLFSQKAIDFQVDFKLKKECLTQS